MSKGRVHHPAFPVKDNPSKAFFFLANDFFRFSIPAWPGEVFLVSRFELGERTLGIEVSAGYKNRIDQCHRSHVRDGERWTCRGGDQMSVAVARDGCRIAIRDSEGGHAQPARPLRGFDRYPQ